MTRLAILALVAACGDNGTVVDVFTATSGTRLAVQKYRFDDGTEQTAGTDLYDKAEHTRCAPHTWIDGVTRCVPIADDAVYTDAACSMVVGRSITMEKPTHFLVYEYAHGMNLPARLFRAGAATDPVPEYFTKQDDQCMGPFPNPIDGVNYFSSGDEVDGSSLPEIVDDEVGDGAIALELHTSTDGLRVPFGIRDRARDAECVPVPRPDGTAVCEPIAAPRASYFADPACTMPVVVDIDPSAIVQADDGDGCAEYHHVGGELAPQAYMRVGGTCAVAPISPSDRVYALAERVDLPVLGRTLESVESRRLQRIILDDGSLHFVDDRLFDTATRSDCRRYPFGDITRCIPAALGETLPVFGAGCAVPIDVANLPRRMCERPAFAAAPADMGLELRAIGDPTLTALFLRNATGQCQPFATETDHEVHTLGPPLDPTTFEGSIYFGER